MTVIPFPSRSNANDAQADINGEGDDLIHETDATYTYSDHTQPEDIEATATEAEWKRDADTLGTNELKRKYPRSFSSFNNISGRARTGKATVDPEFRNFKSFFRHMGPRKHKNLTLDRIDNDNPRYGPGLCEWTGKKEQARNRRTTIFVIRPETSEKVPLVAVAEELGVPASRLRRQRKDGWTDADIFAGRRLGTSNATVAAANRWPWEMEVEKRMHWEDQYRKYRLAVSKDRYEFRYEFAIRRLRELKKSISKYFYDAWEKFGSPEDENGPAADGRETMPQEFRDEYDSMTSLAERAEQRLASALNGESAWRATVSDADRDTIPFRLRRDQNI